ncbi:MAG: hypothetical protein HQL56_06710 [Magnetococcales bacterium]|nr:hypothetical protein [Magnetococcales bacterium]
MRQALWWNRVSIVTSVILGWFAFQQGHLQSMGSLLPAFLQHQLDQPENSAILQTFLGVYVTLLTLFLTGYLARGIWDGARITRILQGMTPSPDDPRKTRDGSPLENGAWAFFPQFTARWKEYLLTLKREESPTRLFVGPLQATVGSERFFNTTELVDIPLQVEFFRHLPGLLTGTGIVGTFAGLLVGLSHFNPTVDPEQLTGQLRNLFQGVSTAFIASFLAISSAILVTLLEKFLLQWRYAQVARLQDLLNHAFGTGEESHLQLASQQQHLMQAMDRHGERMEQAISVLADRLTAHQTGVTRYLKETLVHALNDSLQHLFQHLPNASEGTTHPVTTPATAPMDPAPLLALGSQLQTVEARLQSVTHQLQSLQTAMEFATSQTVQTLSNPSPAWLAPLRETLLALQSNPALKSLEESLRHELATLQRTGQESAQLQKETLINQAQAIAEELRRQIRHQDRFFQEMTAPSTIQTSLEKGIRQLESWQGEWQENMRQLQQTLALREDSLLSRIDHHGNALQARGDTLQNWLAHELERHFSAEHQPPREESEEKVADILQHRLEPLFFSFQSLMERIAAGMDEHRQILGLRLQSLEESITSPEEESAGTQSVPGNLLPLLEGLPTWEQHLKEGLDRFEETLSRERGQLASSLREITREVLQDALPSHLSAFPENLAVTLPESAAPDGDRVPIQELLRQSMHLLELQWGQMAQHLQLNLEKRLDSSLAALAVDLVGLEQRLQSNQEQFRDLVQSWLNDLSPATRQDAAMLTQRVRAITSLLDNRHAQTLASLQQVQGALSNDLQNLKTSLLSADEVSRQQLGHLEESLGQRHVELANRLADQMESLISQTSHEQTQFIELLSERLDVMRKSLKLK